MIVATAVVRVLQDLPSALKERTEKGKVDVAVATWAGLR